MQYSEGQLGRVFVLRIDDSEDFLGSMEQFIREKEIQSGIVLFLGALKEGCMVTGHEELIIPPAPHFIMFEGRWETFGAGIIYPGENGPDEALSWIGRPGRACAHWLAA